jgi:hypothetical protein
MHHGLPSECDLNVGSRNAAQAPFNHSVGEDNVDDDDEDNKPVPPLCAVSVASLGCENRNVFNRGHPSLRSLTGVSYMVLRFPIIHEVGRVIREDDATPLTRAPSPSDPP